MTEQPPDESPAGDSPQESNMNHVPWRMLFPLPLPPISDDSRPAGPAQTASRASKGADPGPGPSVFENLAAEPAN